MKIFVSHSSRQKLFVEKIQGLLPASVELWLDEHKLLVGDHIDATLEEAISNECDLVMLVIDEHAAQSAWVRKELAWAIEHEKTLSRPYLLPIVLDHQAWESLLDEPLRARKYLSCPDFAGPTVTAFVESLVLELFAWLVRDRKRNALSPSTILPSPASPSPMSTLDSANMLASSLAARLRTIIHPHRRDNPLRIDDLAEELRKFPDLPRIDVPSTLDLLRRLRASQMLRGVFFDRELVYLARETNTDKRELFAAAKDSIAKAAFRMIRSGDRVGIDGGSTTLQVALHLREALRAQSLTDLEIFTNSVPVAHSLLETLSELGAADHESICRITLMGGWCRPTSLTVVPIAYTGVAHGATRVSPLPSRLDISFLGTNGLHGHEGFGLAHKYEVPAKRALLKASKRKVVLTDPSKFEVQQPILFARFDEGLEILTAEVREHSAAIKLVASMLEGTSSTMTVC